LPYCPNCGKNVGVGENYCPTCGSNLSQQQAQTDYTASQPDYSQPIQRDYSGYDQGGYQQPPAGPQSYSPPPVYPMSVPQKSPGVALILGLLLPLIALWGIGHIYVGKLGRGIMWLIIGLILIPVLYGIAFVGFIATFGAGWILLPILSIVVLILWIWQAFDAYQLANKYNQAVQRTGMPPW
jgi:hypothetical protein